ncbi:MAG: ECF transporter S component [Selenomonadaceae bacterium]|nr:ECF transporter S component [Selenomonadaceae bacterium]MBQ1913601.1 ECF transporter S component [Selenomonadaceae bacterium]MBQ3971779.1 ECF transporter S component [Selenomonadaceae bacterium]
MLNSHISNVHLSTRQLCVAAAMGVFVFLMTVVPRVPIPLGYAHLGDAAIFLAVLFAGRREGILAGCFGSAFADLVGGFPVWIGPTLLIKFLMADTFWRIAVKGREKSISTLRMFAALVLACLVMTAGYTFFGAWIYDSLAAGLASTPGLLMKSAVNILVFYAASSILKRSVF